MSNRSMSAMDTTHDSVWEVEAGGYRFEEYCSGKSI